jgi:hypothetical protein
LIVVAGITLLSADDFETWFFAIEVMGDSLYQVCGLIYEVLILMRPDREKCLPSSSALMPNIRYLRQPFNLS